MELQELDQKEKENAAHDNDFHVDIDITSDAFNALFVYINPGSHPCFSWFFSALNLITLRSYVAGFRFQAKQVESSAISVDRELGGGAFGNTYLARYVSKDDESHDVAVKMLKSSDKETQERFLFESKLLIAINHPNIVSLYAVHTTDMPFINVMELMGLSENILGVICNLMPRNISTA